MRYYQIQRLDEVRQTHSEYMRFLASPLAKEMKAGFEAELIFPDLLESGSDDIEPDYDMDEGASDIDDIIRFFSSGYFADFSYNSNTANRVREKLYDAYYEWTSDKQIEDFQENLESNIREYLLYSVESMKSRIQEILDNDEAQDELSATEMAEARLEQEVETAISERNDDYDSAYESWIDENESNDEYSEYQWLRENHNSMSEIGQEFDLVWPHYYSNDDGDGEYSLDQAERLARDLEDTLDIKAVASGGYHSTKRDEVTWIFEPDSSLSADADEDMPVEIVSPPMQLPECIDKLDKFISWAKSNSAYANESTGFHMNLSLPEHAMQNIDYVKLALFLGDEYILKSFNRSGNYYCRSAIERFEKSLPRSEHAVTKFLNLMRNHLLEIATKEFSKPTEKYSSIHAKNDYIEFRGPGGKNYIDSFATAQDTMLRMAMALSIAADPNAYRQEYAKKLYKFLNPRTNDPNAKIIEFFAKYVSGNLPKEQLKNFIKQIASNRQSEREFTKVQKTQQAGEQFKWEVKLNSRYNSVTVNARNKEEAIRAAATHHGYGENIIPLNDFPNAVVTKIGPVNASPEIVEGLWKVVFNYKGSQYEAYVYATDRETAVIGAMNKHNISSSELENCELVQCLRVG